MDIANIAKKAGTTPEYVTKFIEQNETKLFEDEIVEQIRTDMSLSILKTLSILEYTTSKTKDELLDALHITREQLETEMIKNSRLLFSHMDLFAKKIATIRKNIITYIIENWIFVSNSSIINSADEIVGADAFAVWQKSLSREMQWSIKDIDNDVKNIDFAHEYKNLVQEMAIEHGKVVYRQLDLPLEVAKNRSLFGAQIRFLNDNLWMVNKMSSILIATNDFSSDYKKNMAFTNATSIYDALKA